MKIRLVLSVGGGKLKKLIKLVASFFFNSLLLTTRLSQARQKALGSFNYNRRNYNLIIKNLKVSAPRMSPGAREC